MVAKVCMFLNYGHHLNAADDFSSLSVVLGSLGGDTCIVVWRLYLHFLAVTSTTFALIEFDWYRVKMVEVVDVFFL